MKKLSLAIAAVFILGSLASNLATAQDYSYYRYKENKERYAQTLGQILDDARADLGIEIEVAANAEPFLTETVPVAPWKLFDDADLRLAYFLAPLDLTFEKTGEKSYRVFEPWYQRRPESEGAAHLQRLVRRFSDKESWEKRRADVRAAILETFDLNPLPAKTPLNPKTTEVAQYNGYTTQDVALEIVPKIWVCGTLYRPTADGGPFPLVASPHGHGELGRFANNNQYRAATLARMGAVVFSYGMFAWRAEDSPLGIDAHRDPISGALQTLATIRVIDYLTSLENVDSSRIGITGASGGGTQTFLATAVDDRITVSAPVVMVSAHSFGGCPCESGSPLHAQIGGLCNPEIAAVAAPRPQLLVAVEQDWTKNTPNVEYPYLKTIYGYYDAADSVEYAIFNEPHDYGPTKRQAVYPFLAKTLGLDLSQADETKVTLEKIDDMLPFGQNLERYPVDAVRTLDDVKKAFAEAPRETAN